MAGSGSTLLAGYTLSARAAAAEARYAVSRTRSAEGDYRPGPYTLPVTGGALSADAGQFMNWWQMGYDPTFATGSSAIVQACVSAYAQTAAMCTGAHWRVRDDGGRDRVTSSALSRLLRKPNAYQSPSDFILNLLSLLYRRGNAHAVAIRNDRFEIAELHLMRGVCFPRVAGTGDIFYSLSGNEVIERQVDRPFLEFVPARDVLHVRLETPRHPLIGETPLTSAMLDIAASNSMARQALAFYDRQARPSGTLNTDQTLTATQVAELRDRWNEQSRGLNAGGTPILTNGLKWNAMSVASKDSQFAEVMKMTDQNVALAFRVPLQILGIGDTPFASTESLMGSWLASGLGFALNHVEQAFDRLFALPGPPGEYTEFDTAVLLRSDFASRVTGWVEGVKGGIFARNEARADFEFGKVKGGDEPWVQQQDVPLGAAADQASAGMSSPEPDPAEGDQDAARAFFSRDLDERTARYALSLH